MIHRHYTPHATHTIHNIPCPITLKISMESFKKNMFFLLRSCWSCSTTSDIPVGTSGLDWLAYIAGYLQRWIGSLSQNHCNPVFLRHGNILTKTIHACAGLSNQSVYLTVVSGQRNDFLMLRLLLCLFNV